MASFGTRLATGLLAGAAVGASKYLEQSAQQRWDEKMERMRQANRAQEREEDRQFQREIEGERQFTQLARDTAQTKAQERRDEARDASENARLDKTLAAQDTRSKTEQEGAGARAQTAQAQLVKRSDGTLVWVSPDGKVTPAMDGDKPLAGDIIKPGTAKDTDPNLLTADEDRTVRNFEDQFKDAMGRPDRAKVIAQLAKTNKKLAEKYAGEPVSADGLTQSEARKKATAEADGKKKFLSSRSTEFSQDGGDPAKFIERRTAELMGAQQAAPAAEPGTATAAEPSAAPKPQNLAGEGTRENPFTATTQADIDWFKANAPKGAVIMVNGTAYKK